MTILMKNVAEKFKKVAEIERQVRLSHVVFGAFALLLLWASCCAIDTGPSHVPRHLHRFYRFPEGYNIPEKLLSEAERNALISRVERLNAQAEVLNWDKYRPVHAETTIIIVHVHKDVERLQYLIISLGQVRYIWRVLLIFSHSYYDDEINNLIKRIDFCRVLQIFYPYSMQMYPSQFPWIDYDDCNLTLPAGAAPGEPCLEREARRAQYKWHWWWTAHYVFNGEWRSEKRMVLFLKEDNYVLPDLLHVFQRTRRLLPYFRAEVMSFGGPQQARLGYDSITIQAWEPSYEKGLAFNLRTWWKISERSSFYCFHDDCEWSQSLVPVFRNFTGGFAKMAAVSAPRVLSTSGFASGRSGARWAWSVPRLARLFPETVRARVPPPSAMLARARRRRAPRPSRCGAMPEQVLYCLAPLVPGETTPVDPLMTATTKAPPANSLMTASNEATPDDSLKTATTEASSSTALPTKNEITNLLHVT